MPASARERWQPKPAKVRRRSEADEIHHRDPVCLDDAASRCARAAKSATAADPGATRSDIAAAIRAAAGALGGDAVADPELRRAPRGHQHGTVQQRRHGPLGVPRVGSSQVEKAPLETAVSKLRAINRHRVMARGEANSSNKVVAEVTTANSH